MPAGDSSKIIGTSGRNWRWKTITEEEYAEIVRTGMYEGEPCQTPVEDNRCPKCGSRRFWTHDMPTRTNMFKRN